MKNKALKTFISTLLASVSIFGVAACGGNNDDSGSTSGGGNSGSASSGERPAGSKIVIYAGGSSEFSWVKGGAEADVIEAIEQQYYEDTGNSLDFEISFFDSNMTSKLTNEISGGSQVDIAISHTRGGSGIDDTATQYGSFGYVDLYRDIKGSAPNLLKNINTFNHEKIDSTPMDALTTSDNKLVGIPSVINPYKFGILARKDYMDQLGYTADKTLVGQTCPATGAAWELVDNLETFEEMCYKINGLTGKKFAVSGAPWDLEKVLTLGAFGVSGYFTETLYSPPNGGKDVIVSGDGTEGYKDVLALEMRWAQQQAAHNNTSVISPESQLIKVTEGEGDFIAGNTGVFVLDPTVQHLINVARKTKANNANAEFVMLEPMRAYKDADACPKDASGNPLRGFMRNTEATFAAIIPSTSTNANKILKFMNWVYKDADNYNLCRYGVEGVHWEKVGETKYKFIGKDSKGNDYSITNPAYSGILTLVENQNISNLVYDTYSEQELSWIEFAKTEEFYIENNVIDYMLAGGGESANYFNNIRNGLKDNVVFKAWAGGDAASNLTTADQLKAAWKSYIDQYYTENSEQRKFLERKADDYKAMKEIRDLKKAAANQ